MEKSDEFKKAMSIVLRILSRRDKTEFQIRKRLEEFDKQTVERVIDYLRQRKFVDDRRFAEIYYRDRKRKRWGSLKIRLAMKNLGISEEIIDSVMKDLYSYEKQAASELLERRRKDEKEKNLRFLLSRGFSYEVISELLSGADELINS